LGGFFALLFAKRFWLGHALTNQMVSPLPFIVTHLGFSVLFIERDVSSILALGPAAVPCPALPAQTNLPVSLKLLTELALVWWDAA
jgi:hypothetical protein